MEGGGPTADSRRLLRVGVEQFLNELRRAARDEGLELRVICCGGRREAHSRSAAARAKGTCDVLLLVDSENAVDGDPRAHLVMQDEWRDLESVPVDQVHLMVQVMETWLVADKGALQRYYGRRLRAEELPNEEDLETVPKADILASLRRATAHTPTGKYRKMGHARGLLSLLDTDTVRARCRYCDRLFNVLASAIDAA